MNLMPSAPRTINKLHLTFDKKKKSQWSMVNGQMFKAAFTLIELLVVIAIIGILAALGTVSYSDSQKKARDNRRKSDLVAIQKALELAKQDSAGNYTYPNCVTYVSSTNYCLMSTDSAVSQGSTDLASTYIKKVPLDPKAGTGYGYYTWGLDGTTLCTSTSTCTTFSLVTCLENLKDPQRDEVKSDGTIDTSLNNSTICASGTKSYTKTNL